MVSSYGNSSIDLELWRVEVDGTDPSIEISGIGPNVGLGELGLPPDAHVSSHFLTNDLH